MFYVLGLIVDIYFKLVFVQVILHWLIHFRVLTVDNQYAQKTMSFLEKITEPVYSRIRRKVPPFSGIDFSPFIFMVVLLLISRLLFRIDVLLG